MMMDRYSLAQKVGIYCGIAVFLLFILLPFLEMFRTSLSPMSHLFHAPYEIWNDEMSFQAYRDMWTKDVGLASVETGIQTVQDSLNVTRKPIVFCSTIIYPLGSATPWSDPQILNAQMLAMIGQGVRGLSFWGGHDDGAVDGRFLHLLAKWNAVLAAAGPFLWDGRRDDAAVTVPGADGTLLRKHVWLLKNEALVFVANLTQEDRMVSVQAPQPGARARDLLTGRAVDLSQPVKAPALDAVMVVLTR